MAPQGLRRLYARQPYSARSRGRKWGRSEGNRDTVCRKARGQFPKNPWGWSYRQAQGLRKEHDDPARGWNLLSLSRPG